MKKNKRPWHFYKNFIGFQIKMNTSVDYIENIDSNTINNEISLYKIDQIIFENTNINVGTERNPCFVLKSDDFNKLDVTTDAEEFYDSVIKLNLNIITEPELIQPKNQKQQVLWYLIFWDQPFSLGDVIEDSKFHKFQTRLSEIEKWTSKPLVKRDRVDFINRFGNKSSYFLYSCIDVDYAKELFKEYEPKNKK